MLGRLTRHEEEDRAQFKRVRKDIRAVVEKLDDHAVKAEAAVNAAADTAAAAVKEAAEEQTQALAASTAIREQQHAQNRADIASLKRIIYYATGGAAVLLFIAKEVILPLLVHAP
jgi:Flp pilus assembly protein TadB